MSWQRIAGQAVAYAAFMLLVGYLSNAPVYRHLDPGFATIKLSLRHAGQILGECRDRSVQEMADLPENMRVLKVCPRERSPLLLELLLEDELVYSELLPARGLHQDGRASVYHRLTVPAGETNIQVRLKDHMEAAEFQYVSSRRMRLKEGANLVIDFDEQAHTFEFLLPDSDQGAALQDPLNDLEAGDGEYQDDDEVDHAPVRQRLAATLFDQPHDPVRKEIKTYGNDGEQENLRHIGNIA